MKANKLIPLLRRGDGSTLSLDFTAMSSLDSRFTFTRASTATYINSSGLVTTMAAASTNDPTKARFDYDPTTLAPRGLLIEGSVVNIFPYSNAMTGGQYEYGVSNSLTATFNNTETASPDGSNNSVKVVKAAGGQTYTFVRNQVTPQTSGVHTGSVWVKKPATSGSRYVGLRLTGAGFVPATPDKHLLFDLDTGTVVTGLTANGYYTNPTIVAYPNGWYRISITSGTMSTGSGSAFLSVCMSTPGVDGSEFNTLAAGTCFYMFGPQVEAGSGASSYIPTGSSNVQRASESCSFTGTNFSSWYNQTQGTLLARILTGYSGGSPQSHLLCTLDSDPFKRLIFIPHTFDTAACYDGSTVATAPGDVTGSISKIASAYTQSQKSICSNGGTVATATVAPGYSTATSLLLGHSAISQSTYFLNLKFWPTRLPDAQMQSITQ